MSSSRIVPTPVDLPMSIGGSTPTMTSRGCSRSISNVSVPSARSSSTTDTSMVSFLVPAGRLRRPE